MPRPSRVRHAAAPLPRHPVRPRGSRICACLRAAGRRRGAPVRSAADGEPLGSQLDGGERGSLRGLTALAARGQPDAIESLLQQIRPMVVRYCRARLGRIAGRYHVADDVAQEVRIAVLSALPRYRDIGRPFASFVFGIASHKVADAVRNAGRLAIPTEDLPDGPDHRPGPEETVVAYIEAKRALALLARLPVQQRELLVLRVLTGLSAEETGHELGMPGRSCPGRPAPRAHAAPGDSAGGMDRLTRRRGRDEAARALG